MTEECGVWHPQEGVLMVILNLQSRQINRIGQLRQGVEVIENLNSLGCFKKYTIADMITGFGVAEAVRHFYSIYGGDVKAKKSDCSRLWKCRFSSYL
jgi:hypothetical protein